MERNAQQNLQPVNQIHLANIQKRLDRRLKIAIAKGDKNLVRQLEAEKT